MIFDCLHMFMVIITLHIVSDSGVVTSYSMNLSDIERRGTNDERKEVDLDSRTEDAYKSNGVIDIRERFFDRNHSHSTIRDSKVTSAVERKKPGISILHDLK